MINKEISQKILEKLDSAPKTASETNDPMKQEKQEALYNAFMCYDEEGNVCGYNIQVRVEEMDIYKLRFYLPLVDSSWERVKRAQDLPDKMVKVGYDGEFQSQNELLRKNDIEIGKSMFLNFNVYGITYLGAGFVGIADFETLYRVVRGLQLVGYPVNDETKKMYEEKKFI